MDRRPQKRVSRILLSSCLAIFLALAAVAVSAQAKTATIPPRTGPLVPTATPTTPAATGTCNLYASPAGSDSSGDGSASNPYATVDKLDASLAPGQTGCLMAGTYGSISTAFDLANSGSAGQDITITSAPGQTAKLDGLVELYGSYTVLSGLEIDGSNDLYTSERSGTTCPYPVSNGLEINGHDDIFQNNDFYQSIASLRGNGIGIGWDGQADRTIVRYNRIHDLGQCRAFDHMVYIAKGTGVQVYDNWMWNDPHGFGVQLYPAAVGAHVYDNVIDAAGSGVIVCCDPKVSGNVIEHNVITNSTGLPDAGDAKGVGVSDYWDNAPGAGNVFENNDVYDNPGGVANVSAVTVSGDITSNPMFNNAASHDYRVATNSPAASWGLWDGGLGSAATSGGGSPNGAPVVGPPRRGSAIAHATSAHRRKKHHHRRHKAKKPAGH